MVRPATDHRAFADTSAFAALANRRDDRHDDAVAISRRLSREHWRLYTTNFVLAETHALLLARLNRIVAAQTLHEIDRSNTTIIRVTVADERRAREIVYRYTDKDFSLTDATSFAVMERLRLRQVYTFDRDFAQFGFQAVTA